MSIYNHANTWRKIHTTELLDLKNNSQLKIVCNQSSCDSSEKLLSECKSYLARPWQSHDTDAGMLCRVPKREDTCNEPKVSSIYIILMDFTGTFLMIQTSVLGKTPWIRVLTSAWYKGACKSKQKLLNCFYMPSLFIGRILYHLSPRHVWSYLFFNLLTKLKEYLHIFHTPCRYQRLLPNGMTLGSFIQILWRCMAVRDGVWCVPVQWQWKWLLWFVASQWRCFLFVLGQRPITILTKQSTFVV